MSLHYFVKYKEKN